MRSRSRRRGCEGQGGKEWQEVSLASRGAEEVRDELDLGGRATGVIKVDLLRVLGDGHVERGKDDGSEEGTSEGGFPPPDRFDLAGQSQIARRLDEPSSHCPYGVKSFRLSERKKAVATRLGARRRRDRVCLRSPAFTYLACTRSSAGGL